MRTTFRSVALLASMGLLASIGTLQAQVRPDVTRQLRGVDQPCGFDECFHHTMFRDVAPELSPVAGRTSASRDRLSFQTQGSVNGVTTWGNNVRRLTIRERGDEPCHVELQGSQSNATWSECGGNPGSTRSAGIDAAASLIGLKICNNGRSGERGRLVKGVELEWATRPHEINATRRILQTDVLTQPNCSRWRNWVHCPDATAAQTMIIHHESIGGRRAVVGLQLECYPVVPNCLPGDDPGWANYSGPIVACHAGDR